MQFTGRTLLQLIANSSVDGCMTASQVRWLIGLAVPLLCPPLLEWAFMARFYDINAIGAMIGMSLGILGIALWPSRLLAKVLAIVFYIPAMGVFMFIEGAGLACGYYHSCL